MIVCYRSRGGDHINWRIEVFIRVRLSGIDDGTKVCARVCMNTEVGLAYTSMQHEMKSECFDVASIRRFRAHFTKQRLGLMFSILSVSLCFVWNLTANNGRMSRWHVLIRGPHPLTVCNKGHTKGSI